MTTQQGPYVDFIWGALELDSSGGKELAANSSPTCHTLSRKESWMCQPYLGTV